MNRDARARARGLTLVELALVIALIGLLAGVAMPFVHHHYLKMREIELKRTLTVLRNAIDRYHEYAVLGQIEPWDVSWNMYPKDLQSLVDGVDVKKTAEEPPVKVKFLRGIPNDPMTMTTDWYCRGYKDSADERSTGCDDVYDIFSTSPEMALDGTYYKDW